MTIPEIIIASFGGSAILLAAVGFMVKSIINHFLSKDIEKFKKELELATIEHQVRFSNLHEKRALVISKLFELISEAHQLTRSFTSPLGFVGQDKKKEFDAALKKSFELSDFADKNKIYFPEDICSDIEELVLSIRKPTIEFGIAVHREEEFKNRKEDAWTKAWQAIDEKVPPIRKKLESEFRKILGSDK